MTACLIMTGDNCLRDWHDLWMTACTIPDYCMCDWYDWEWLCVIGVTRDDCMSVTHETGHFSLCFTAAWPNWSITAVLPLSSGHTRWELPDMPTTRERLRGIMDALGCFQGFGIVAVVGILLELYLAVGIGEPADSVNMPWRLIVGYVSANHLLYAVHHMLGTYSASKMLKETAGVGP